MKSEVVIAIIKRELDVLIVKRKEGEGLLRWQFPGGEIKSFETEEQAVIREVLEETSCHISIDKFIGARTHPYTKKAISYWGANYLEGEISISDDDIEEVKWVNKNEIKKYFTTSIYDAVDEYLKTI